MYVQQDSSGTTLMDLISSDPTSAPPLPPQQQQQQPPPSSSTSAARPASPLFSKPITDRKSKKSTLMQIQSDAVSAARAAVRIPHKHKKKVY